MDSREIRQKFLDYFKARGHEIVESASLIPKDDPTLLFTNAGMVQFKRSFLGEEKRGYSRAVTSQKCVRAGGKHNDLENVGYTLRHHTFFEMLGNFSFGDYFKEEAITWAWELLTDGYGLPEEKMYVSVYKDDDEAYRIWEEQIGIPAQRIVRLGEKDNFWSMGDTGPCGPCSEILIDQGPSLGCGKPGCGPGCDCDRYLEIWNLVFTQFNRNHDGTLNPLPKPNIDTGMGLERLAAVVQGVTSNYETDIFIGLISSIQDLSQKAYNKDERQDIAFRVISDHARSTAFLIGDGIIPSNEGRGYVLRRIIRRAIRFGQVLGLNDPFFHIICRKVIDTMGKDYGELTGSRSLIDGIVCSEEKRFADTLHYSMKVLDEEIRKLKAGVSNTIPGEMAFKLYDTYGLSVDIVEDVARVEGLHVDIKGYEKAMSIQRSLSQQAWKGSEEEIPKAFRNLLSRGLASNFTGYKTTVSTAKVVALLVDGKEVLSVKEGTQAEIVLEQTPFYGKAGGQTGDTGWILHNGTKFHVTDTLKFDQDLIIHQGLLEKGTISIGDELEACVDAEKRNATELNHSATHLLHAALREVLGDHVKQAGSFVSPDRLRFDFSHFTQVPHEKLREVELLANRHIRDNLEVCITEMSKEAAMETGAMAIFEERYGDTVRLVRIGDGVSIELCGGTHTKRTGNIGLLRIINESSVAANVRRIEALTAEPALIYSQGQEMELRYAGSALKATPDKVVKRVERLLKENRDKDREMQSLKARLISNKSEELLSGVKEINGISVIARKLDADSTKELREYADKIKDKLKSGIILVGTRTQDRAILTCVVTKDLVDRFKAGDIISQLSVVVGGKGGGRPDMAQGGGSKPEKLDNALQGLYDLIAEDIG